jgi:hypothetical protein
MAVSNFRTSSIRTGVKRNTIWDQVSEITVLTDYLVIAGGGGGGGRHAGGGGAGGYRTSAGTSGGNSTAESQLSLLRSTNYSVTVGNGGAGCPDASGSPNNGSKGGNSIFHTITSLAGGAGEGAHPNDDGGSGGAQSGLGTTGQGSNAGTVFLAGSPVTYCASGGGGAGAVGGNASGAYGGNGGAGLASSITGTSVTRAGGGGGGTWYNGFGSTGGSGGGGDGAYGDGRKGSNATINTGSGGGGGGYIGSPGGGGNGAAGIVILKYPDAFTITIGAGLTGTTAAPSGGFKVTTITAGTGNVSFA